MEKNQSKNFAGTTPGKKFIRPDYARFKAVIRYRNRHGNPKCTYYSWDFSYQTVNGTRTKINSEGVGLIKLQEFIFALKPWQYYAASVFANVTSDLSTANDNGENHRFVHLYTHYPVQDQTGPLPGNKPIMLNMLKWRESGRLDTAHVLYLHDQAKAQQTIRITA